MPRKLPPRPRIPRRVKMAGQWIKIRIARPHFFPDHLGWAEMPDVGEREIVISHRASRDAKLATETIRHEMMHMALNIAGLTHAEKYDEEVIIRALDQIFWPAWEIACHQIG